MPFEVDNFRISPPLPLSTGGEGEPNVNAKVVNCTWHQSSRLPGIRRTSSLGLLDLLDAISQRDDRLQCLHGGVAVVLLFGVGQLFVSDQAGMFLPGVVALGAKLPAVLETLQRPELVFALG